MLEEKKTLSHVGSNQIKVEPIEKDLLGAQASKRSVKDIKSTGEQITPRGKAKSSSKDTARKMKKSKSREGNALSPKSKVGKLNVPGKTEEEGEMQLGTARGRKRKGSAGRASSRVTTTQKQTPQIQVPPDTLAQESEAFWQRQNDVERFTQETKTRKLIQDLVMPILDNQTSIHQKIEFDVMTSLNDLTDRLQRVEYALYKSENPETRFDNIYEQLQSLETGRK